MTTSSARKINPKIRETEFPEDFQALSETVLICIHCNHEIEWEKKSTIIDHLKTKKHLECKLNSTKVMKSNTLEEMLRREIKNKR